MTGIPSTPELAQYSPEPIQSPRGELLAMRFDVNTLLESKIGPNWQEVTCDTITNRGELIVRGVDDPTCREADPSTRVGLITLHGDIMAKVAPGIWELYNGTFKQMMQMALPAGMEPLRAYEDPIDALECLSQQPAIFDDGIERRIEAHVDQRRTAVLVLAEPNSDTEGRLVVGNNPDAQNIAEINADPTYIVHRPGTLVCFSKGSIYPHYTEEITDPTSRRIVISMNYPRESETPEEAQRMREQVLGKTIN